MIKTDYINIDKIVKDKEILKLFKVVENCGGVLRFVGGCVRDALKNIEVNDIDLATDLNPDELVEACEDNKIKTVPIGLKHGTVGVILSGKLYEVTSLRKDIKTDGRHAEVIFTTDFAEDASRRDLTINAVYADEKGNVYDYYNGLDDLEKGKVKFIGNANNRIKEDYLRILRFFRFYSIFGVGEIDKKALQACSDNAEGITRLSTERVRDEVLKILATDRAAEILKIMEDAGILDAFIPHADYFTELEHLINLELKYSKKYPDIVFVDVLRRFFIAYMPDPEFATYLANRFKFTKKQKQRIVKLASRDIVEDIFEDENYLKKMVYLHGKENCVDEIFEYCCKHKIDHPKLEETLRKIKDFEIPEFPLTGKDIINVGFESGRNIGEILNQLKAIWIDEGFSLDKMELLARL
jgi:poly(A) polymerase